MGKIDRIFRIILTLAIAVLYWQEIIDGTTAIIMGVIALIFLVTSFISFCPIYSVTGLSTNKDKKTKN